MIHEYSLEVYKSIKSRYTCPNCGKARVFTRYINNITGEHLSSTVGRCNREIECGYHYAPKQFFIDNKEIIINNQHQPQNKINLLPSVRAFKSSLIEISTFYKSLKSPTQNNFVKYLFSIFGSSLTSQLIKTYFIGGSKHWQGATVFWQIDIAGNVRAGKVMLYDLMTGKRVKNPYNHITWVHTLLHIENFCLNQCFFGEHLLNSNRNKPVAIVESEKTAIISSVYFPQFIWVASGGIGNLKATKFSVLKGRRIFLFPDEGGYDRWQTKASEISDVLDLDITVSDFLEKRTLQNEKMTGIDLADLLVNQDGVFGWALSEYNYPIFWDKV